MVALEGRARLVSWQAPGFTAADVPFLQRVGGLLYPDVLWVPDVLVSRVSNGLAVVLPDRLQALLNDLTPGEAFLYRRGQERFSKIVLEGT